MISNLQPISQIDFKPHHLQTKNGADEKVSQVALKGLEGSFLTIYQNVAQLTDAFSITVQDPKTELVYRPLLKQMIADSAFIHIDKGDGKIIAQSSETTTFSLHDFYQSLVGEKVALECGDFANARSYEGIVFDVQGNQLILLNAEDQFVHLSLDKVLSVKTQNLGDKIAVKPHLSAVYQSQNAEEIEGQVTFLTNGLHWNAHYRLILEKNENGELKGRLLSDAKIINQTEKTLKDVVIQVVSGSLNLNNPQPMPYATRNKMLAAASFSNEMQGGCAVDQTWEEYKAYLIPYKMDLKPAQRISTTLFDPKEVSIEKCYVLHTYEHDQGEKHPSISYHIENSEENGLGQAFPDGKIQVFNKKGGLLNFTGEHTLPQTPNGKDLDIVSGEAFDLRVKRSTKTHNIKNDAGKLIAQEITVTLAFTNGKEEDAKIYMHEHIHGEKTLLESSIELPLDENEQVFEVVVPKNTKDSDPHLVTYKYRKDCR